MRKIISGIHEVFKSHLEAAEAVPAEKRQTDYNAGFFSGAAFFSEKMCCYAHKPLYELYIIALEPIPHGLKGEYGRGFTAGIEFERESATALLEGEN